MSEVERISALIRYFETNLPELYIDLEMNSLEDAYVQMVEGEQIINQDPSKKQNLFEAKTEAKQKETIDKYMRTQPQTTFFTQMMGITMRRFLIFIREPRQWFMILSPFIIVLSMIILLDIIVLIIYADKPEPKGVMTILISAYFPFFVLYGFCLSAGIYMLVLLQDRDGKMRPWMYLQGLGSWAYYGGMWLADITLFFITEIVFVCFILSLGLKAFSEQLGDFMGLFSSFGAVVIPCTYFCQHFFKDQNSAFKLLGVVYLIGGLIVPNILNTIFADAPGDKANKLSTIIFFIDPFYCMYLGTSHLIISYYSSIITVVT